MVQRFGPSTLAPTRSRVVVHGGLVTTVAVSTIKESSLYAQSVDALATVDRNLEEAGTDKSRIVMATCYITDIR